MAAFQDSGIPHQICDNCLNSLKDIYNFRQKCLQSIKIHRDYAQILNQKNESFKYPLIRITDIFEEQQCEILEDIQNLEEMESEYDLHEEIKSEISETDCYSSETETNEQMLGNFEMVEFRVKKEINEEIMIKEEFEEDSNLFEDKIPNNSEIHGMKIEDKNGYISSDESNIDSQSTHPDTDPTDGKTSINRDTRPYECNVCQKTFKRKDHMKQHNRIHSNNKPHSCDICQKSFTSLCNMKTHKLTHTGQKPYSCEGCHKSFTRICSLKKHNRNRNGGNPYICPVCRESFKYICAMKYHESTHSEEQHICEICNRSYKNAYAMRRHKRTHIRKKVYECEVCHRSFNDLSNMKRHKRLHNSYKLFNCTICHKSIRSLFNFRRHELTHSKELVKCEPNSPGESSVPFQLP